MRSNKPIILAAATMALAMASSTGLEEVSRAKRKAPVKKEPPKAPTLEKLIEKGELPAGYIERSRAKDARRQAAYNKGEKNKHPMHKGKRP